MNGQVYMIRNTANGKVYIGKSKNFDGRIYSHMLHLKHGKHSVEDMQNDFDNGCVFECSIIGDGESLEETETAMMDKHKSCFRECGYNYKDPHAKRSLQNAGYSRNEVTRSIIRKLSKITDVAKLLAIYKFVRGVCDE